jgi:two-component system response regulator FixJ
MSVAHARGSFIAVIEDDKAVLDSLQFALEAQGYRVCLFANTEDALNSREIMSADCLVIDYALPDVDGITMLSLLRGRGLGCPAIVIASNPTSRCRMEAAKAGAPLVEKPIMGHVLEDVLRAVFAGRPRDASNAGPAYPA